MDRIKIRRDAGSPVGFESSFEQGELYFDITAERLYIYNGAAFVDLASVAAADIAAGVTLKEQPSTPATPAAGAAVLFLRDNGSGKQQLCIVYDDGSVNVIDTQL